MDPEQTFIRVQERFSQMLTPRLRIALEYIYLVFALSLFGLLVVMHANFVQQPGCSSELSVAEYTDTQLVHIKITSIGLPPPNIRQSSMMDVPDAIFPEKDKDVPNADVDRSTLIGSKCWLHWLNLSARKGKLVEKSSKNDHNDYLEVKSGSSIDSSSSQTVADNKEMYIDVDKPPTSLITVVKKSLEVAFAHICTRWGRRLSIFQRHMKHVSRIFPLLWNLAGKNMLIDIPKWSPVFHLDRVNTFAAQWLEEKGSSFELTYIYTVEKGYFLLPEGAKFRHNIHTVNISISARDSCFGNRWQQLLINRFIGYDTILMNTLLSSPGQGYLYNSQTREFYLLSYAHEPTEGSARFGDYLVAKCGVLIMSLFVFFTTTMSVSFTLRETQTRMLKFTVQLEHHARNRLPTFQLIFVHVIESLVFVPIMIGILFFLFEFYDDQVLAFMVLILVWLCELFTLISVRTPISMKFFPRFFLLYFLVFHIYFFSYPYGFSYVAFATTAVFMQHLILYFWNRFEVPALQRFMQNRRSQFQQPTDMQFTSSAIVASTLHIARLNMRNPGPGGMRSVRDQVRLPNIPQAESLGPDEETSEISNTTNSLQVPGPPQPGAIPNPNSLSSFSSMLFWILGGASLEGCNLFFSLFRDVRDQGEGYPDPHQPEDDPVT